MTDLIQGLSRPVIHYKILAAGRNDPAEAFAYCGSRMRPQDLACVGVFTGDDPRMLETDVRLFERARPRAGGSGRRAVAGRSPLRQRQGTSHGHGSGGRLSCVSTSARRNPPYVAVPSMNSTGPERPRDPGHLRVPDLPHLDGHPQPEARHGSIDGHQGRARVRSVALDGERQLGARDGAARRVHEDAAARRHVGAPDAPADQGRRAQLGEGDLGEGPPVDRRGRPALEREARLHRRVQERQHQRRDVVVADGAAQVEPRALVGDGPRAREPVRRLPEEQGLEPLLPVADDGAVHLVDVAQELPRQRRSGRADEDDVRAQDAGLVDGTALLHPTGLDVALLGDDEREPGLVPHDVLAGPAEHLVQRRGVLREGRGGSEERGGEGERTGEAETKGCGTGGQGGPPWNASISRGRRPRLRRGTASRRGGGAGSRPGTRS